VEDKTEQNGPDELAAGLREHFTVGHHLEGRRCQMPPSVDVPTKETSILLGVWS